MRACDTNDTAPAVSTVEIEAVPLVEASDILGDLVLRAAVNNERFILTRRNKDAAAIIGPDDIKRLAQRPGVFEQVEVPSTEARARLGRLVVQASIGRKRFLIGRYGEPAIAALVGLEDLEFVQGLDAA